MTKNVYRWAGWSDFFGVNGNDDVEEEEEEEVAEEGAMSDGAAAKEEDEQEVLENEDEDEKDKEIVRRNVDAEVSLEDKLAVRAIVAADPLVSEVVRCRHGHSLCASTCVSSAVFVLLSCLPCHCLTVACCMHAALSLCRWLLSNRLRCSLRPSMHLPARPTCCKQVSCSGRNMSV